MNIAIIPARGQSKRIPRKNIKYFFNKPIIAWSIESAIKSGCFKRIIVSTDDQEIADISKNCGAEVPFLRKSDLADDFCGTNAVVVDAIKILQINQPEIINVCCIYATAPFIQAKDIINGLKILEEANSDFAMAVTNYSSPIQRSLRINKNQRVEMINPEQFSKRSQDFEKVWHDAGQFYWGKLRAWLEGGDEFNANTVPIILDRWNVHDIDNLEDWKMAEIVFEILKGNRV